MKPHYPYLTVLRALAISTVVGLHATSQLLYQPFPINTLAWHLTNFVDYLLRWGVPVFVMMSGALVIKPSNDVSWVELRRRFTRIVIPAVFWIICFFFWINRHTWQTSIAQYLIQILVYGNPYYHFYYIFLILGLYALLPIINNFMHHQHPKIFNYTIGTLFASAMFYNLATSWFKNQDPRYTLLSVTHALPYIGYFLLGYHLHHHLAKVPSIKKLVSIYILTVVLASLATFMLVFQFGKSARGLILTDYLAPNVLIVSVCIFLIFKQLIPSTISQTHQLMFRLAQNLANASLGIYLAHLLVMEPVVNYLQTFLSKPTTMLISYFITITTTWLAVNLLSKLPFINKTVGY